MIYIVIENRMERNYLKNKNYILYLEQKKNDAVFLCSNKILDFYLTKSRLLFK